MSKYKSKINEGLEFGDLKGLIDNNIMIDMYRPKIGNDKDTVVIALNVTYEAPAKDLTQFIETGDLDHLDVESAPAPDEDGSWKVFIEFLRDRNLFEKVQKLLTNIEQLTGHNGGSWTYVSLMSKKPRIFNKENFKRDVITSKYEYSKTYNAKKSNNLEEHWLTQIREYQKL